jgi:hypothetical protein
VAVGVRFPEQIWHMEAIVLPRRWEDFGEADGIFRAPRSDKGERMIFDDNFRPSVTARWSRNGRLAITRNAAALQLSLINGQLLLAQDLRSSASSGRQERRGLTRDDHVGSASFFLRTSAKTRTAALRPARETNEPGGSAKQSKLRQSCISRRCRSVPIGLLGVLHG